MKNRLNFLCMLVIIIILYPVIESAMIFGASFSAGRKLGKEMSKEGMEKTDKLNNTMNMKYVNLIPDNYMYIFNDSVYNEKTNSFVPVFYSEMGIRLDSKPNIVAVFFIILSSFIYIFSSLAVIILFIGLIISINKSRIFTWKNVTVLRWLGILLIVSFIFSSLPHIISYFEVADNFAVRGYKLSLAVGLKVTTLILGIASFIVGEIFAIGLRMKEEQELTI